MSINAEEVEAIIEVVSAVATAGEALFAKLRAVVDGKLDPNKALADIKSMNDAAKAADDAAKATLDSRFPNG